MGWDISNILSSFLCAIITKWQPWLIWNDFTLVKTLFIRYEQLNSICYICHSGNTYKYSGRINQRTARACWLVSSGNNRSSAICKNWATLCELIACERWPGIWSADQSKTQILHTFYHIWEICLLQGKICVLQLTDLKVVISQYWKQQLIIMTTFTFQKH